MAVYADTTTVVEHHQDLTVKIENYLLSIDYENRVDTATIFTNFIVKERGEIFNVDFMVTEKEEIVLLSKEQDDEFYRVDSYNSKFVRKYSVPVTNILI